MLVKQISVFLENQKGSLLYILELLEGAGVDVKALSIADTTDFGILRLIVNDPSLACRILRENECTVSETEVIAISISNSPGGLKSPLTILNEEKVSVEYMYAFASTGEDKAYVILKTDDPSNAAELLSKNGIAILKSQEICGQ